MSTASGSSRRSTRPLAYSGDLTSRPSPRVPLASRRSGTIVRRSTRPPLAGLLLLLLGTLTACGNGSPTAPPDVGRIRVTAATTGHGIPDGYTVSVQAGPSLEIGANGVATFENVPVGVYTVRLTDMADHCTAESGSQAVVEVLEGEQVDVAFSVTCVASELIVRTSTTGPPARSTGWSIRLNEDASESQSISPNGQVAFGVAPGDHNVRLAGLPDNCATPGPNPVIVIVPAMASTGVTIQVECESGELTVTVTTDGNPDPVTSYTVTVEDETQPIDPNGTVVFAELPTGPTSVTLGGLPSHCTVVGANPITAEVPGSVEFEVDCPSICGEPPSNAILSVSPGTGGGGGVVATVAIEAAHGDMSVDVLLEAAGQNPWFFTNQYVEALDWFCLEPDDPARVGEEVIARFVATGEVSATSGGLPSSAEGSVYLNFASGRLLDYMAATDDDGPNQIGFDDEVLVPVTLGTWTQMVSQVDVRVGTENSARATASLVVSLDEVREDGGATVPLAAVRTASGTQY